jgi:glutamate dehydrogenase/leucine dehydrogenase
MIMRDKKASAASMKSQEQDPRWRAERIRRQLQETMKDLRHDIEQVEDPRLKAIMETSAEVIAGLLKTFQEYARKSESAWH